MGQLMAFIIIVDQSLVITTQSNLERFRQLSTYWQCAQHYSSIAPPHRDYNLLQYVVARRGLSSLFVCTKLRKEGACFWPEGFYITTGTKW